MSEHQDLLTWLVRFALFKAKEYLALTEEERLSIREQKQVFLEEIGVKEDSLMDIVQNTSCFLARYALASTDEEEQPIMEEMSHFFKDAHDFKKEVDKRNHEKRKNSTAPAA